VTERSSPTVQVIDLGPGLWIWRLEHPSWNEQCDWQEVVTSVCVDAGNERWLLDPLLPPDDATQVWERLDRKRPTAVAILIPDHNRPAWGTTEHSIDAVVRRYGCRAFGPDNWSENKPPRTPLQKIEPDQELPGGLLPFRDPRGWSETPLWLPEQHTLVFGDALTERGGALRVWMSPTHQERAIPDLRAMLDLPFERLIISHGEPSHTRQALEQALERPPWPATPLHLAAYRGNFDKVRSLVEAGADVTARDERHNATPLGWAELGALQNSAQGSGYEQIVAYLRSITPDAESADK